MAPFVERFVRFMVRKKFKFFGFNLPQVWILDSIQDYEPLFDVSLDLGLLSSLLFQKKNEESLKTSLAVKSETPAALKSGRRIITVIKRSS